MKPYFLGNKDIIKSKLDEIGSIRNSLAHFRPLKSDDVDLIKQNSKHVLLEIEKFLYQVLIQNDLIPTNTQDTWYNNLKTIGTDQCSFSFHQSYDNNWIRLKMQYSCPIIKINNRYWDNIDYTVLSINSSLRL